MNSSNKIKGPNTKAAFIAVFAALSIGLGYVAIDQYWQNQEMQAQIEMEMADMNHSIFDAYAEIENNLAQITAHEDALRTTMFSDDSEGALDPQQRIQQEIDIINGLMEENRSLISDLNERVGVQDGQLAEYENQIDRMSKRVTKYKKQAKQLAAENKMITEDLANANASNAELNSENERLNGHIAEQVALVSEQSAILMQKEDEENTVYYTVGTYKELNQADVIEKDGGVIGIGATKTLMDDFNRDEFTKIDKRLYKTIPVFSKKAELVTHHNSNSYEIVSNDEGVSWIKITDPELFWEQSDYLVVATRDGWDLSLNQEK